MGAVTGELEMTDEAKKKLCWWGSVGGIPLAVLITWIFSAGVLRGDYRAVKDTAYHAAEVNNAQELRILKLEMNVEYVKTRLDEIGTDVKLLLKRQ